VRNPVCAALVVSARQVRPPANTHEEAGEALSGPLIESFKFPEWIQPPFEGFVNVVGEVIPDAPDLALALLRFDEHGTIPEHSGE